MIRFFAPDAAARRAEGCLPLQIGISPGAIQIPESIPRTINSNVHGREGSSIPRESKVSLCGLK